MTCIKGYLEYAARKDVSFSSVYSAVAGVKCLRVPKREKYVLEDEQVAHILSEAPRDEKGSRNRVMLLLYDTAMRVSELTALETNQLYLDRKRPFAAVRGKGNKDRHIALSEKMDGILKSYRTLSQRHADWKFFYSLIKIRSKMPPQGFLMVSFRMIPGACNIKF
jgi:integrase/recombinase XerD